MNAPARHHEIDGQCGRGRPAPALVLVRTDEQSLRPTNPATTDSASMSELWRIHGPALQRFALKLTLGDRQRAEDIVQETLFRAWRRPEVVNGHVETLRPWLFTVVRHMAIDLWRTQSRHDGIIDKIGNQPTDQPNPVEHIEQAMTAIDVHAAIARLAPIHRDVIVKMYYLDQSVLEIAQRLGIPEGTIKSRSHYAQRHLKRLLQPSSGQDADQTPPRWQRRHSQPANYSSAQKRTTTATLRSIVPRRGFVASKASMTHAVPLDRDLAGPRPGAAA